MSSYSLCSTILSQVGMTWNSPRIKSYIKDLEKIHGRPYIATQLPQEHFFFLHQRLQAYSIIDSMLKNAGSDWNDPVILNFFSRNSVKDKSNKPTNRLKQKQWERLADLITELYCPF